MSGGGLRGMHNNPHNSSISQQQLRRRRQQQQRQQQTNGSAANSKRTTAAATPVSSSSITNSSSSSSSSATVASIFPEDLYHNAVDRPCCRLLEDIALDILDGCIPRNSMLECSRHYSNQRTTYHNHHVHPRGSVTATTKSSPPPAPAPSIPVMQADASPGAAAAAPPPRAIPLLAQLIRNHFVLKHVGKFTTSHDGMSSNPINSSNHAKKKRKKKRKNTSKGESGLDSALTTTTSIGGGGYEDGSVETMTATATTRASVSNASAVVVTAATADSSSAIDLTTIGSLSSLPDRRQQLPAAANIHSSRGTAAIPSSSSFAMSSNGSEDQRTTALQDDNDHLYRIWNRFMDHVVACLQETAETELETEQQRQDDDDTGSLRTLRSNMSESLLRSEQKDQPTLAAFFEALRSSPIFQSPTANNNSNQQQSYHVTQALVSQAVQSIRCRECRSRVEDILDEETKLPLHRPTMIPHGQLLERYLQKQQQDHPSSWQSSTASSSSSFSISIEPVDYFQQMLKGRVPMDEMADSSPPWALELYSADGKSAGWGFRGTNTQSDEGDISNMKSNSKVPFWSTLEDMETWLIGHVLIPGLHPDILLGVTSSIKTNRSSSLSKIVDDGMLDSIRQSVDSACVQSEDAWNSISRRLQSTAEHFAETAKGRNRAVSGMKPEMGAVDADVDDDEVKSNIDLCAFSDLKRDDDSCYVLVHDIFEQITPMLGHVLEGLVLDHGTQAAACASSWAIHAVCDMYEIYLETLQNLINSVRQFENSWFELANRHGVLPQMYVSRTARSLYRSAVEGKIFAIYRGATRMRQILDRPVTVDAVPGHTWTSTTIRRILTEQAFAQVIQGLEPAGSLGSNSSPKHSAAGTDRMTNGNCNECGRHEVHHHPECATQFDSAIDWSINNVLVAGRQWCETVIQGNIEGVHTVHHQRYQQILRLLTSCHAGVEEEITKLSSDHSFRIEVQYVKQSKDPGNDPIPGSDALHDGNDSSLVQLGKYLKSLLLECSGERDPISAVESFRASFKTNLLPITRTWIYYRVDRALQTMRPADSSISTAIPLSLKRTMMLASAGHATRPCVVGHGIARATAILVGLFYKWLQDRCMEWQAHLAEQELLTTIENDNPESTTTNVSIPSGPPQPSKKSKKKKSKKVIIPETAATNDADDDRAKNDDCARTAFDPVTADDRKGGTTIDVGGAKNGKATTFRDGLKLEDTRACVPEVAEAAASIGDLSGLSIEKRGNQEVDGEIHPSEAGTQSFQHIDEHPSANGTEVAKHEMAAIVDTAALPVEGEFLPNGDMQTTIEDVLTLGGSFDRVNDTASEAEDLTEQHAIKPTMAGLYDNGIFLSAENFFVGRLAAVLASTDGNTVVL